jgi:hypothetical protein
MYLCLTGGILLRDRAADAARNRVSYHCRQLRRIHEVLAFDRKIIILAGPEQILGHNRKNYDGPGCCRLPRHQNES